MQFVADGHSTEALTLYSVHDVHGENMQPLRLSYSKSCSPPMRTVALDPVEKIR